MFMISFLLSFWYKHRIVTQFKQVSCPTDIHVSVKSHCFLWKPSMHGRLAKELYFLVEFEAFCHIWVLDFLRFGSNATDERLLLVMFI